MAVIKTNPDETQTIEGVEHGATISLILDRSNPGQGPGFTATPTTRPGSWSTEPSTSRPETRPARPALATS